MRRTLVLDLPRNVSSREYALYTLQWGLVMVGLVGAVGVAMAAMDGTAHRVVDSLEQVPGWTIADAASQSEPMALIRVEGELVGSGDREMPDEPGALVVLGSIEVVAKTLEGSNGPREAVLHRWEHAPDTLWLADGEARVRLEIEPDRIPRMATPRFGRPDRVSSGAAPRLSRTIGFRYMGQEWSLPEAWGEVRSASARVERGVVPVGSRFVATGRLEPRADGMALVALESTGGQLHAGTLDELRTSSEKKASVLRFAWLPLLLGAAWLLRRVLRIRRDFVRRSNEGSTARPS